MKYLSSHGTICPQHCNEEWRAKQVLSVMFVPAVLCGSGVQRTKQPLAKVLVLLSSVVEVESSAWFKWFGQ